jgi:uncharacterized LabA/DUF88 family protein
MIFIDGQNLLYACEKFAKEQGKDCKFYYREEDLEQRLVSLQPGRKHIQTRFYTAILEPDADRGEQDVRRYEKQLKRCKTLETKLKWHVFSKTTRAYPFFCPHCRWSGVQTQVECQVCRRKLKDVKNKGVDVAIATDLVVYGMSQDGSSYDVAILVSGDNDFVPVIRKLKDRRPQVKIEIAQFENAVGYEMREVADKFYPLDNFADKIGTLRQRTV